MPTSLLNTNPFTEILQEFSLDFRQRWIPFLGFQPTKSLSITADEASAKILSSKRCYFNDFCYAILNA